jgi:hypothetical protein
MEGTQAMGKGGKDSAAAGGKAVTASAALLGVSFPFGTLHLVLSPFVLEFLCFFGFSKGIFFP